MEYLYITLAVLFTSLGQVMQKFVADRHLLKVDSWRDFVALALKKETLLALLFLGLGLISWLATLRIMEVSKAFPFLSTGFIVVMLFAKIIMNESIPWFRWLGVLLICLGLSLIAQT